MTTARKLKAVADPLEKYIKDLQLEYLQCRDFGHSWRPYTAKWVASERIYLSTLRCARCTTMRIRKLNKTGGVVGSNYDYPEYYLAPPGTGRMSGTDRDKIRLASLMAVLSPDTAEENWGGPGA